MSKRAFITGIPIAVLPATGCLFGSAHRGEAEQLSGQLTNDTESELTATVSLKTTDGTIDFEREYELSPDEPLEFEVANPDDDYSLTTEVSSGLSKTENWDVTPCSSHVLIEIDTDGIKYNFSAC